MKNFIIIFFILIPFNCFAVENSTTFKIEIFEKAQSEGKTVVINSWNKTCYTCKKQIKILDQAEKEFKDVLFLSFEQTKDKEIANYLSIEYWTTIVVYKNSKEVSRSIGQTEKSVIYSNIQENMKTDLFYPYKNHFILKFSNKTKKIAHKQVYNHYHYS